MLLSKQITKTIKMSQIQILHKQDSTYPELLKEVYKPPDTLYCRGDIALLKANCLAIVGTRKNSDYGEYWTHKIIETLSVLDIVIVSGLAKGIDTIAHKLALRHNLATIAVLGSGLNKIYPAENQRLAEQISSSHKGLLLSEFPPETDPIAYNFPQRNRIISGLSMATLVIEAPSKSGALITARYALEQGRDIFVLPTDLDRESSLGNIDLLQRGGAYPLKSAQDILEILLNQKNIVRKRENPAKESRKPVLELKLNPAETLVMRHLSKSKFLSFDHLQTKTEISIDKLLHCLTTLEIKNLIETRDGKYRRKMLNF